MKKGIILAAGKLPDSLTSEIGLVPPVFLPFGGTFLLYEQLKYLKVDEVYLTLPEDFIPNKYQEKTLQALQVKVLNVSPTENVKLAFSKILSEINYESDDDLDILMGDTLFTNGLVSPPSEFFSINYRNNDYNFTKIEHSPYIFTGHIKLSGKRSKSNIQKTFNLILDKGSAPDLSPAFIDPWFDLGHFNDFFQSKVKIIKARHFNSLSINNYCTTKKSTKKEKIINEIVWYQKLPANLAPYSSHIYSSQISNELSSYTINTNHGHLLSDLLVYYEPSDFNWKIIYGQIAEYLNELEKLKIRRNQSDQMMFNTYFSEKTSQRAAEYRDNANVKVDLPLTINSRTYPSILNMIDAVEKKKSSLSKEATRLVNYIHGDFCFSNIFFDFRAQKITLIDPRGYNPALDNASGPLLYELVKLAHSAVYNYDYIIQGWYKIEGGADNNSYEFSLYAPENQKQRANFSDLIEQFDFNEFDILYGTFHLFISMVPLHSDDANRQKALIGVACEIYSSITCYTND